MQEPDSINWLVVLPIVISIASLLVNLIFNIANYISNKITRKNTVKLASFNSSVRTPIEDALKKLEGVMDAADDIVLSSDTLSEKLKRVSDLKMQFHAARRQLGRSLYDCDISQTVEVKGWCQCDEGFMDTATESFDAAMRAQTPEELRGHLHAVAKSIADLRNDLRRKLDDHSSRLMQ